MKMNIDKLPNICQRAEVIEEDHEPDVKIHLISDWANRLTLERKRII